MILITGGTGFVGNVLIRQLSNLGYPIRLLIRPSKTSPNFPSGIPLEVAITSFSDSKGLRAAMKGVDIIYHLASAESLGRKAQLTQVDINGTEMLVEAAKEAKIGHFYYLSHLGADGASAYPLLKAKGMAEQIIKKAGIPYTIFRSAVAYGYGDHFTNGLAFLLKISPFLVPLPDEGSTLLQPIWVEDLVTVMTWAIEIQQLRNETIEIGGPDYLSFKDICKLIIKTLGVKRRFISVPPVSLNVLTELLEILTPNFPTSVFWMDYLATNRTTSLDILPSMFNLIPAPMNQRLGHLEGKSFRKNWWKFILKRKRTIIRWD
jgi:NADH dehydrogenase